MSLECLPAAPASCTKECYCRVNSTGEEVALDYSANVGIAFALVAASGLSTGLGASVVFCNRVVKRSNHKVLGASLGFSSGVMILVSFVEILGKSQAAFESCECLWEMRSERDAAYIASLLCFFLGMLLVYVLDFIVHRVSKSIPESVQQGHDHVPQRGDDQSEQTNVTSHPSPEENANALTRKARGQSDADVENGDLEAAAITTLTLENDFRPHPGQNLEEEEEEDALSHSISSPRRTDMPALRNFYQEDSSRHLDGGSPMHSNYALDNSQHARATGEFLTHTLSRQHILARHGSDPPPQRVEEERKAATCAVNHQHGLATLPEQSALVSQSPAPPRDLDSDFESRRKLMHMGLMTAMAIGLHNFPEGLATFVATLADAKVGAGLAVAISIHNIPEGLCVAIPIYYATGSRWKGFGIALFSGVTEIIGAALGYAFLMAVMGPAAYAVLFGVVAGMMICIALKELIPTAHAYDETDTVVSTSIFLGMIIMAVSLMLFKI